MSSPATVGATAGAPARRRGVIALTCLGLLALALSIITPTQVHAADAATGHLSLSVTSTVSDASADFSNTSYTIRYRCYDGQSGYIDVRGDGTPVTSPEITADTQCSVSLELWSAERYGYRNNTPDTRTVSIVGGQSTDVSFALTYQPRLASLWIGKRGYLGAFPEEPSREPAAHVVPSSCGDGTGGDSGLLIVDPACMSTASWRTAGNQDATNANFINTAQIYPVAGTVDVHYSCAVAGEDTPRTGTATVTINSGEVEAATELPLGTVCTIAEDLDSAQRPGFALATRYSETTVTIHYLNTPVTVYNSYTPIDGSLQISKTVDGNGAAAAPESYTIDYTCTDDDGAPTVSGEVTLAAGATETIRDIPSGHCTLTERDATAADATLTTTMTANDTTETGSTRTVAIDNDTTTVVSVTNTYTRDTEPEPTPTATAPPTDTATTPAPPADDASHAPGATTSATPAASKPALARTGVATALPLALLAAALTGGALLRHRRRA